MNAPRTELHMMLSIIYDVQIVRYFCRLSTRRNFSHEISISVLYKIFTKIRPAGVGLIHADRLRDLAKPSKSMHRGLYNNYSLKTVNLPCIGVGSETVHRRLYGTVPKRAALPLVKIRHSTVLKPNI